jgi:hypothetical protein
MSAPPTLLMMSGHIEAPGTRQASLEPHSKHMIQECLHDHETPPQGFHLFLHIDDVGCQLDLVS